MSLRRFAAPALGLALIAGFVSLSLVSYVLFHSAVEMAGTVVSFAVFTLAWNLRRSLDNTYLLVLGIASLFLGGVNVLHALAYKGMGVFPEAGADLPTQLWIAGRYIEGLTLLAAPFAIGRQIKAGWLVVLYAAISFMLVGAIFTGLFPACFVDGVGLTPFKRASEYLVVALMVVGLIALWRRRTAFDPDVLRRLIWSVALTALAELIFTLYVGVYDLGNMTGHLIRLVAVYLLYEAMVQTGLTRPFDLLFRNLKQSETALERERNFSDGVLDSAGSPLVVVDDQGRIVRFNKACQELTGYTAVEVAGKVPWDLLVPESEAEAVRSGYSALAAGQSVPVLEAQWVSRTGEQRLLTWSNTTLRRPDGSVAYVISSGTDVTERRQAEAEMKDREQQLRVMVESVQTGMVLVDRQTRRIASANPASAALIGLPADRIIGRACTQFFQCAGPGGQCPLECEGPDFGKGEPLLVTAGGRKVPIHRTSVTVMMGDREHFLESFMDMSRHKQLEDELRALSLVDELTGLYNRRGFVALAGKEIDTCIRLHGSMSLLFIDLKGLKEINDTWGHAEGDRALAALASVLRQSFQETCLVGRFGGDEFVVLASQFAGANTSLLLNRLEQYLDDFNCTTRRPYELQINMGTARFNPDQPCSVHELINQADTAMYLDKRRRATL
jgi:diguanylate cyclase (GGDEF)-like protein/PAS domain S-box-containing protein